MAGMKKVYVVLMIISLYCVKHYNIQYINIQKFVYGGSLARNYSWRILKVQWGNMFLKLCMYTFAIQVPSEYSFRYNSTIEFWFCLQDWKKSVWLLRFDNSKMT